MADIKQSHTNLVLGFESQFLVAIDIVFHI